MSNNRHHQRWTPADVYGRTFPGHAHRSAGSARRDLASGRRSQRFGSRCVAQHDPRLVRRGPRARMSAYPLHCRIKPYWIKSGACGAAGPASAPPLSLGRPARRTPGLAAGNRPQISQAHPAHSWSWAARSWRPVVRLRDGATRAFRAGRRRCASASRTLDSPPGRTQSGGSGRNEAKKQPQWAGRQRYSELVVAHALSSMGEAATSWGVPSHSSLNRCSNVSMPISSAVATPVPTISGSATRMFSTR